MTVLSFVRMLTLRVLLSSGVRCLFRRKGKRETEEILKDIYLFFSKMLMVALLS